MAAADFDREVLLDRLVDLELELSAFREAFHVCVGALFQLRQEREQLRTVHLRLVEDFRRLRRQTMAADAA
jgi:hypothetical protein